MSFNRTILPRMLLVQTGQTPAKTILQLIEEMSANQSA
jgi:hypothetical protein